jgi:MFS family permease
LKPNKIFEIIKSWIFFLKRQHDAFKTNILKNFAQKFSTSLTYQYQSIYISSLGASPLLLGYISSLGGVVNTLLSIPAGIIADRFGLKKVFLFTIMIYILSALVFGLAFSWEMAAIALVLSSAALTLDRTTCPMICGATLDSSERVTGMGICDTISFFPQLIAPLIAAFLISMFGDLTAKGIRPLYFLQITGLFIAFIVTYTKFENPKLNEKRDFIPGILVILEKLFQKE